MRPTHLVCRTLLLVALAASACADSAGNDDPAPDATQPDTSDGGADTPGTSDAASEDGDGPLSPGAEIAATHAALADAVAATLDRPEYFADGEWLQHYGDASMYGPSYDLARWAATGDEHHRDRGLAALESNLLVVEDASEDLLGSLADLETVSMALLGLLEAGQFIDDSAYLESAEGLMGQIDTLAAGFDDYLAMDAGQFAATTYGPTAISSFLALMHLEHALAHPERDGEIHLTRAGQVLEHVHERAWDDALGAYRFAPDDERRMLYPNITMMLAYGRALQLTGEPLYRERIDAIYAGIEPLRDVDGDHFHSPYSAEYMGADDEDYSTLSSQNYLMMGLWLAWVGTSDGRFLDDIDGILTFLEAHLLVDGRLLHHWMNGAPAVPEDPEYFCSGCNLQTLYVLRMLEESYE